MAKGVYILQHDNPTVTFGVSVYGLKKSESYGYPGGLRLPLTGTAQIPGTGTGTGTDTGTGIGTAYSRAANSTLFRVDPFFVLFYFYSTAFFQIVW